MRPLSRLSFKFFDRREGLSFIPGSKVNLGVLFQKCLVSRNKS